MSSKGFRMSLPALAKSIAGAIRARLSSTMRKEYYELRYWRNRREQEGVLSNAHYEPFYTRHFGFEPSFYTGKVILDIGCGPRGSLEWASNAARRIGVDPLAEEYLKLGASEHGMEYIAAPSESIPLPDGACDAVFSFNSLDHVEDFDKTVREIKRITKPGGVFLLLVEVNHPPTTCEPHLLTPGRLLSSFEPEFKCVNLRAYEPIGKTGIYNSIDENMIIPDPRSTTRIAYLSAHFVRNEAGQ